MWAFILETWLLIKTQVIGVESRLYEQFVPLGERFAPNPLRFDPQFIMQITNKKNIEENFKNLILKFKK